MFDLIVLKVFFAASFVILVNGNSYDGFKVYDIEVKSEHDLEILRNLEESEGEKRSLDFLSFHRNVNDKVKLMVKPDEQKYIEGLFKEKKLNYKMTVDNVQE